MSETAEYYVWQGYELLTRGEALQAELLYRQALQIEPGNVDAMTGVMQCLYIQGKYRELVDWSKRVLSSPVRNIAFTHEILGAACMEIGRYHQAADHFQQAMALDPASLSAVQGYVRCLRQSRSRERLKTLLPEYVARFPDDPFLLHEYGMLLASMGDYARALEMLQRAASLDPSFYNWHALSWVLGKLKRWAEAKEALFRAIDAGAPDEAIATLYCDIGIYELYAGNLSSAETFLWKALESFPSRSVYFKAYRALLLTYWRQRRMRQLLGTYWKLLREILRRKRPYRDM